MVAVSSGLGDDVRAVALGLHGGEQLILDHLGQGGGAAGGKSLVKLHRDLFLNDGLRIGEFQLRTFFSGGSWDCQQACQHNNDKQPTGQGTGFLHVLSPPLSFSLAARW